MEVIEGQSHHLNSSPGFPPRIGVRGMLSTAEATSWESIFVPITKWVTGITMVLRRSHLGDEKRRTFAGTTRANCRRALGWGRDPALHFPLGYRP